MKFLDLQLTDLQARAFTRWLESMITLEDRDAAATAERDDSAVFERRYAATCDAARQTAARDGRTSIPPYLQARAAWDAFVACEGWLDPYDNLFDDQYYNALNPSGSDYAAFQDAWETAYTAHLMAISVTSSPVSR